MNPNLPGRIQINGSGIGEISEIDIERRAEEIAHMDGRKKPSSWDIDAARVELLHPGPPPAPEADETMQPVGLWSGAAASKGRHVPRIEEEDGQSYAEHLVNEGSEEAVRDIRLAASEEDPEN